MSWHNNTNSSGGSGYRPWQNYAAIAQQKADEEARRTKERNELLIRKRDAREARERYRPEVIKRGQAHWPEHTRRQCEVMQARIRKWRTSSDFGAVCFQNWPDHQVQGDRQQPGTYTAPSLDDAEAFVRWLETSAGAVRPANDERGLLDMDPLAQTLVQLATLGISGAQQVEVMHAVTIEEETKEEQEANNTQPADAEQPPFIVMKPRKESPPPPADEDAPPSLEDVPEDEEEQQSTIPNEPPPAIAPDDPEAPIKHMAREISADPDFLRALAREEARVKHLRKQGKEATLSANFIARAQGAMHDYQQKKRPAGAAAVSSSAPPPGAHRSRAGYKPKPAAATNSQQQQQLSPFETAVVARRSALWEQWHNTLTRQGLFKADKTGSAVAVWQMQRRFAYEENWRRLLTLNSRWLFEGRNRAAQADPANADSRAVYLTLPGEAYLDCLSVLDWSRQQFVRDIPTQTRLQEAADETGNDPGKVEWLRRVVDALKEHDPDRDVVVFGLVYFDPINREDAETRKSPRMHEFVWRIERDAQAVVVAEMAADKLLPPPVCYTCGWQILKREAVRRCIECSIAVPEQQLYLCGNEQCQLAHRVKLGHISKAEQHLKKRRRNKNKNRRAREKEARAKEPSSTAAADAEHCDRPESESEEEVPKAEPDSPLANAVATTFGILQQEAFERPNTHDASWRFLECDSEDDEYPVPTMPTAASTPAKIDQWARSLLNCKNYYRLWSRKLDALVVWLPEPVAASIGDFIAGLAGWQLDNNKLTVRPPPHSSSSSSSSKPELAV